MNEGALRTRGQAVFTVGPGPFGLIHVEMESVIARPPPGQMGAVARVMTNLTVEEARKLVDLLRAAIDA